VRSPIKLPVSFREELEKTAAHATYAPAEPRIAPRNARIPPVEAVIHRRFHELAPVAQNVRRSAAVSALIRGIDMTRMTRAIKSAAPNHATHVNEGVDLRVTGTESSLDVA
jgi:hypothetical protein